MLDGCSRIISKVAHGRASLCDCESLRLDYWLMIYLFGAFNFTQGKYLRLHHTHKNLGKTWIKDKTRIWIKSWIKTRIKTIKHTQALLH